MAGNVDFKALLDQEQTTVGKQCDLSKAFEKMPDELANEVRDAMDGTYSAASIARTLQRCGYEISEGSVRRCRRICKCWKS